MIKAVIFDLDNTLLDFMKMKSSSIKSAIDGMIEAGLDLDKAKASDEIYDIYDKNITIKLIKRIRDEKKFNSSELLRDQLELDRDFSFKYLEENEIEIK